MCGICGAISISPIEDLQGRIQDMNGLLVHRGPDSEGAFSCTRAALAMRRLAIIDLETGDQPISNENGSLQVILNGEIYNYQELSEDLRKKGHQFKTRSDTETIVHAFEEYGTDTPKYLHGMFAFAVYDLHNHTLFLARDRFGEKPLYYYACSGTLVFSSEVTSLLQWPGISRAVDKEALGYYLRMGLVPSPLTLFQAIRELPPGSWMLWRDGVLQEGRYFTMDYRPDAALDTEDTAREALKETLERVVRRQTRSDVPLGAFLSGGIDSSTIVALVQAQSSRPIKTYTLQIQDKAYDESNVAGAVARYLETDHHVIPIENRGFSREDLERVIEHVGMPLIDESAIAAFMLSQAARQEVKVCLTGDGGDEMFAGYRVFPWGLSIHRLGQAPRPMLAAARGFTSAAGQLPLGKAGSIMRKARRAFEAASHDGIGRFAALNALFQPEDSEDLIADPEVRDVAFGPLRRMTALPEQAQGWPVLRQLMYYRLIHNLPQIMLVKGDRMSMAASLELRAPFLDVELASLAARLPDHLLLKNHTGKHILREMARPLLPAEVFSHPKTGFGFPLHLYRNDAYADLSKEMLSRRDGVMALLNPKGVQRILHLGLSRSHDEGDISVYRATSQLWVLVQLAMWSERFKVSP